MNDAEQEWTHPTMTRDEFDAWLKVVAAETDSPRDSWWWLSFCDPERPAGTQFLGGCWVQASSLPEAITVSHVLGLNPGGEVKITGPVPPELIDANVAEQDRCVLLTLAQIKDEMRG